MINVYLNPNGDIVFHCNVCEMREILPVQLSRSVFWDGYAGRAILAMIDHHRKSHRTQGELTTGSFPIVPDSEAQS